MAGNDDNIIIGAATVSINAADVGFTRGGTTIRYEPEFRDITADQAVGTVAKRRMNERLYVKTTLLEPTLERIRMAFMFPSSHLTGGGSTLLLGYNNSCWVEELAIILVGPSPGCGTRTFTLTKCISFNTKEIKMSKEEETTIEIEFECLKDAQGNWGSVVDS